MDSAEIIYRHFPDLTERQRKQLEGLGPLYSLWNGRINVISRKDIDHLYEHHVLHSLAIAKYCALDGMNVLDVGTGGGFPGIPLAILCPEARFTLIDSIGKKIRVAHEVVSALDIRNVTLAHRNAKEEHGQYDYVVSRAVMRAPELWQMVKDRIKPQRDVKGALICLKGDTVEQEFEEVSLHHEVVPLSQWLEEEYFATKCILRIDKSQK